MILTLSELANALNVLYPTRYSHFDTFQNTPFICYLDEGNNPLVADNKVIVDGTSIQIELYTSKKDIVAENKIKKLLNDNDLPYDKDETIYIESEKFFLSTFYIELN